MNAADNLAVFLNADSVHDLLTDKRVIIIDVGNEQRYFEQHIPNARYIGYSNLISGQPPASGLLPSPHKITELIEKIGLQHDSIVITYDDVGGGASSRFVWLLHVIGFYRASSLNGGLQSWLDQGFSTSAQLPKDAEKADFTYQSKPGNSFIDKNVLLSKLHNPNIQIIDCRSKEEYEGIKKLAKHGGHIPGSINMDWTLTKRSNANQHLVDDHILANLITERQLDPAKETIVYCQTHHRSSHTYVLLTHLGFKNVRGYAGSWSEWGNDESLPYTN